MESVFTFMVTLIKDLEKELAETRAKLDDANSKLEQYEKELDDANSKLENYEEDANEYLDSDNGEDYPEPSFSPSYM